MSAQGELFDGPAGLPDCECEHSCHWDDPLTHAYGQVRALRVMQTDYGKIWVCEQCANTCHRKYLPQYQ